MTAHQGLIRSLQERLQDIAGTRFRDLTPSMTAEILGEVLKLLYVLFEEIDRLNTVAGVFVKGASPSLAELSARLDAIERDIGPTQPQGADTRSKLHRDVDALAAVLKSHGGQIESWLRGVGQ